MSARIASVSRNAPPGIAAYYDGGVRVVIDGVPTRVARRPSRNMLEMMAEPHDYNHHGGYCPFTGLPNSGYAACQCGRCEGSPIVLPSKLLKRLVKAARGRA